LAATLLWGYRLWPGILLGAFLVNFATTGNPATDLGIAVGNTLEALLGAWLVNRFAHGAKAFDRARDIFKFVLLAAMVSTAVSASVGVTSVCLGREAGLGAVSGDLVHVVGRRHGGGGGRFRGPAD
jgi:integral membrane sensor domain MASE1